MGSTEAQTIWVRIRGDMKGLSRTLKSAATKVKQTGRQIAGVGQSLTMGLTAPLVGAGGAALKMSADFNKAMAEVGRLIPGQEKRLQELKKATLDTAVEMGKGTDEMARGMFQVVSAFQDTEGETIPRLRKISKAATAGSSTVRESLELAASVTKSYGDTSADALQKVFDLSLKAEKLGQTTFPELAAGMRKTASSAATLGVRQEELAASFATLTGVTGNTREVATQLDGVMNALIKPTDTMTEKINSLGFESGRALIEQEGLVGGLRKVIETTDGSAQAVGNLVRRKRALRAVFALTGGQADTFNEKLSEMENASGTLDDAFQEMTTGVGESAFKWSQFRAKLEKTAIQLGDELAPALRDVLNRMQPLFDTVTNLFNRFKNMSEGKQRMVLAFTGIAAAAGPVLWALGAIVSSIGTLIGVMGALVSPVGLAVAAIVGGAALIIANWDKVKSWLESSGLLGLFENIWGGIQSVFKRVVNWFKVNWPLIQKTWETVMTQLRPAIQGFVGYWKTQWQIALGALRTVWNLIELAVKNAWELVSGLLRAGMLALQGDWKGAWQELQFTAEDIWLNFRNFFVKQIQIFKDTWRGLSDTVKQVWRKLWKSVVSAFEERWRSVERAVNQGVDTVKGSFDWLKRVLVGSSVIPDMVDSILAEFKRMARGMANSSELDLAKTLVEDAAKDMRKSMSDVFFKAMRGELNSLEKLWKSVLESIQRSIADFLAAKVTQQLLKGLFGQADAPGPSDVGIKPGSKSDVSKAGAIPFNEGGFPLSGENAAFQPPGPPSGGSKQPLPSKAARTASSVGSAGGGGPNIEIVNENPEMIEIDRERAERGFTDRVKIAVRTALSRDPQFAREVASGGGSNA